MYLSITDVIISGSTKTPEAHIPHIIWEMAYCNIHRPLITDADGLRQVRTVRLMISSVNRFQMRRDKGIDLYFLFQHFNK